ncbi:MAG: helix-turn-helix domain-containing protein [Bacillota bacterium]|jgi:transcriptional regulator with XRE-family HTH domain
MQQIRSTATTEEILRELGQRIHRYRLQQNRTLVEVAASAGVGVRTAKRAEAGERPTLETVVRLLRALGRLDTLNAFLPAPLVSPLQLADLGGRERQRAGTPRRRAGKQEDDTKAGRG